MKKVVFYMMLLVMSIGYAYAQGKADIKFEQTTHNFGTFSENSPVVSYTFKFTNVGDAPLVIHQAVASCGCTVPEYSQEPIAPGKTGTVKVTYNGTGRYPGHFKKSITLTDRRKREEPAEKGDKSDVCTEIGSSANCWNMPIQLVYKQ